MYQAQLEEIKKLDEEVEKERQACIVREKEEAEKKEREQAAYEQKIKLQEIENKKVNQKLKEKKLDEIIMIEKEFNVSFGDIKDYKHKLYNIPQSEENMKKYNDGMMNFQICCGCGVYKAYPNQFVNTHRILHALNAYKQNHKNQWIVEQLNLLNVPVELHIMVLHLRQDINMKLHQDISKHWVETN